MAEVFQGRELWLPSHFDFFLEGGAAKGGGRAGDAGSAGARFPCEFTFGLGPKLDSPVESVAEAEVEAEEEDCLAGLTQRMARYFLADDDEDASVVAPDHAKMQAMAGSPQYTLCAWATSNKESPNGPSLVSSPPPQPEQRSKEDPCDLLYAAVGQVMRLRRLGDLARRQSLYDQGILGPARKPSPAMYAAPDDINAGYHASGPVLTHQQLQAAHFYHLKRQQAMKQQLSAAWGRQSKARGGGGEYGEGRCGRLLDLSPSAWPPLQNPPPPQPGMRTVFLNVPGARKESVGTGVFLPRVPDNKLEPRKRTVWATKVAPERVAQALNLSLEEFAGPPPYPGSCVLSVSDDALIGRSRVVLSRRNKNHHLRAQPTTAAAAAAATHEIGLPQEWTY